MAVSDPQGDICQEAGVDPANVSLHKQEHTTVVGYPGAQPRGSREVLEAPCDNVIPAATEGMLAAENAERVLARLIAEVANGPTTPESDRAFTKRGMVVIPDILANAGGVTVCYFEWVQDLQSFFWSKEENAARLETIMAHAFETMWGRPVPRSATCVPPRIWSQLYALPRLRGYATFTPKKIQLGRRVL